MKYIVLENILLSEETQIIKSEANAESFQIDFKDNAGGFEYRVKDLLDDTYVGIKYVEHEDKTVVHYAINSELTASVTIEKDQLGKAIEIEMYNDENITTRGTLPDHNLTFLQNSDILARIDRILFSEEPSYSINIEENHEYRAFILAVCISLDKFLQGNKGGDDYRRRIFGTRFKA